MLSKAALNCEHKLGNKVCFAFKTDYSGGRARLSLFIACVQLCGRSAINDKNKGPFVQYATVAFMYDSLLSEREDEYKNSSDEAEVVIHGTHSPKLLSYHVAKLCPIM